MMHSAIISKIDKAHRYALDPQKLSINQLQATFHGDNNEHRIKLTEGGQWNCDCDFFVNWETCAHVLALQELLGQRLPEVARTSIFEQMAADEAAVLNASA